MKLVNSAFSGYNSQSQHFNAVEEIVVLSIWIYINSMRSVRLKFDGQFNVTWHKVDLRMMFSQL